MAAVLQTVSTTVRPPIAQIAGQAVTVTKSYALSAALVVNDVIEMVEVPAGHAVVDARIDSPDLDSNGVPAIVLAAGLVDNGTTSDCNQIIAGSTVGQAGGIAVPNVVGYLGDADLKASGSSAIVIGIKVTTAPATGATSGTIYMSVTYRPIQQDNL